VGLSQLQQVNAIIGLSKRLPGWPSTLADNQYSLDRIELKLKLPDPRKAGLTVVINPDLLFVSDERNRSLVVELKSGSYNDHDLEQLNRLLQLTPHDLVRYGRVTLPHASAVMTHLNSKMMVVNHENIEGFKTGLEAASSSFCLVSISSDAIQTEAGQISDAPLDSDFRRGIAIGMKHLPTRLVRVLPNSDDSKDLRRYIVDTIKYFWVRNERSVNPQRLASRIFDNGVWDLFDSDAQAQFLRIAKAVLKDMRETEFQRYIQRVPGEPNEWKLVRVPELRGNNRINAIQRFQRAVTQYKQRLLNDVPYPNRHHDQMTIADIEGYIDPL
jgi:hypothetical protein